MAFAGKIERADSQITARRFLRHPEPTRHFLIQVSLGMKTENSCED